MGLTRDGFYVRMKELMDKALELSKTKNADYADGSDPFQNFRSSVMWGVPIANGIGVRLGDKMQRIANLLGRQAEVKDESIEDTLLDAAIYCLILRIWLEENGRGGGGAV